MILVLFTENYKSRSFGFASRNFYAEFLAALQVVGEYQQYFGDVEFHSPAEFIQIKLDHFVTVKNILKTFDLESEEFALLNPGFRPPVLRSQRRIPKGYSIRLPKRFEGNAVALIERMSPVAKYTKQVKSGWYRVKRGDNLSIIAKRFNVSVGAIAQNNSLSRGSTIFAGTVLKIPSTLEEKLAKVERKAYKSF